MGDQIRRVVLGREEFRNRVLGRVERGAGLASRARALKPVRPFLALATEAAPGPVVV